MKKYIPLDALVAKIEEFEKALKDACKPNPLGNVEECMTAAELQVLDFVKEVAHILEIKEVAHILEVKEVDLEKEIEVWEDSFKHCPASMGYKETAKHFYELGMAVSNPITAADRGMVEEIITHLKRVENDYRMNLTKEIEWLRNKVKKGE